MTEEKARKILGKSILKNQVGDWEPDDLQPSDSLGYVIWSKDLDYVIVDGELTIDQLKAIVWWMENKGEQ